MRVVISERSRESIDSATQRRTMKVDEVVRLIYVVARRREFQMIVPKYDSTGNDENDNASSCRSCGDGDGGGGGDDMRV